MQDIVAQTRRVLNEDGSIVDSFASALSPYRILAVSVIPLGPCEYSLTAVASSSPDSAGGRRSTSLVVRREGDVSRAVLFILVPLGVAAVCLVVAVVLCAALTSSQRHRRRVKRVALAASVGKPGVPVIFADELEHDFAGEMKSGRLMDDDDPVAGLPPEYRRAAATAVTSHVAASAGAHYKLLLVASSESDESDDEDAAELNRQHHQQQETDSFHDDEAHPSRHNRHRQQQSQSAVAQYYGPPPLKPAPSYTLSYADR